MTGDVGEETKLVLFGLMIAANAIFVVLWIIAYLEKAKWSHPYTKYGHLEHKYIHTHCVTYFPENDE